MKYGRKVSCFIVRRVLNKCEMMRENVEENIGGDIKQSDRDAEKNEKMQIGMQKESGQ